MTRPNRWISDQNRIPNKFDYTIKIAKLYVISKLIWVPILNGNPPIVDKLFFKFFHENSKHIANLIT